MRVTCSRCVLDCTAWMGVSRIGVPRIDGERSLLERPRGLGDAGSKEPRVL